MTKNHATIPKNRVRRGCFFFVNFTLFKITTMNVKRIFGTLLTLLGIIGLIYAAYVFASTSGEMRDVKSLIIYGILGVIFFLSGISLIRNTKDEA